MSRKRYKFHTYSLQEQREAFLLHVEKTATCWLWKGGRTGTNQEYGAHSFRNQLHTAHRWSYILFIGPVTDEIVVDHKCLNTLCVNPEHLQLLTSWESLQKRPLMRKNVSECKNGHPYTNDNSYYYQGNKQCRRCHANRELNRRSLNSLSNIVNNLTGN